MKKLPLKKKNLRGQPLDKKQLLIGLLLSVGALASGQGAVDCPAGENPDRPRMTLINFDDQGLGGPTRFKLAGEAQTLVIPTDDGNVTLEGGVVLRKARSAPANRSSFYGTAFFGDPTLENTLTLTFENPIEHFAMDIHNGQTFRVNYKVADNAGNVADFTLLPNFKRGWTEVEFPCAGNVITVTSDTPKWDFFIDNIRFNNAVQPEPVPDFGSTGALLFCALAGLAAMRGKARF